jgi:uncharacterized protein YkwD
MSVVGTANARAPGMRVLAASIVAVVVAGCGSDPSTLGSGGGGGGSASSQDGGSGGGGNNANGSSDLQHCVAVLNTYRAQVGSPALGESSALETFAAAGAQSDSQTGQPHGHFSSTNGGNGVTFAENEIPGWPLAQYGSTRAVIDQGLQMMFGEGPGGGHYDNMTSKQYTQVGCGVFVTSQNAVWVTVDFK